MEHLLLQGAVVVVDILIAMYGSMSLFTSAAILLTNTIIPPLLPFQSVEDPQ